jgi:hypothetical protein
MLLHLLLAAISLQDSTLTYDGRAKRIQVDLPRIDTVVNIDRNLDEAVWSRAARPFPRGEHIPGVQPYFTDSHFFRDLGTASYGFGVGPFRL